MLRTSAHCYPHAPHAADPGAQGRADHPVRRESAGHGQHPRPGRPAHRTHQRAHRAPARAQEGPPLAPRAAHARRPAPAAAQLPPEEGPRGLPLAHPRARPAPVIIAAGTRAPEFRLKTEDGEDFTQEDLTGHTTVLVFYPFAFSPVCTDQFQIYEEVLPELEARGARMFGVSTDASYSQTAFREKLGVSIPQLSDFEPKGETARALRAYFDPGGMTNRAIVTSGPGAAVQWTHVAAWPGALPGASLIFDGLAGGGRPPQAWGRAASTAARRPWSRRTRRA